MTLHCADILFALCTLHFAPYIMHHDLKGSCNYSADDCFFYNILHLAIGIKINMLWAGEKCRPPCLMYVVVFRIIKHFGL
jgi:hypothetical protein